MIKANILTKILDDYINKKANIAYLVDYEIKVRVKYGRLHLKSRAKIYAYMHICLYHWL